MIHLRPDENEAGLTIEDAHPDQVDIHRPHSPGVPAIGFTLTEQEARVVFDGLKRWLATRELP